MMGNLENRKERKGRKEREEAKYEVDENALSNLIIVAAIEVRLSSGIKRLVLNL